jgi:hypothetical protein
MNAMKKIKKETAVEKISHLERYSDARLVELLRELVIEVQELKQRIKEQDHWQDLK